MPSGDIDTGGQSRVSARRHGTAHHIHSAPIMVTDTSILDKEQPEATNQQYGCDCATVQPSVNVDATRTPGTLIVKDNVTLDLIESNSVDASEQSCLLCNKTDASTQSDNNHLDRIKKRVRLQTRPGSSIPQSSLHSIDKPSLKRCAQMEMLQRAHECDICDSSEGSSDECVTSCAVQNPEKADRSEDVDERCFDDDGHDFECPCANLECLHKESTSIPKKAAIVKTRKGKDSGGGSSCAGVCEQYYRNKLMATLQILQNKEETIRVQGSSLGVAEARIAALTERACALRCELDAKARELTKLRKFAESCRVEKADTSTTADIQEVENQKNIVETLQDNLTVIAELYRECFYETAKQEEMIDLLRKSYLDVRLMERDKAAKINRLQNVIDTQKWSIEQCQDVVVEVENLKSEISSFLNSSNNDSGMWERGSESPDVSEELGDILDQLRQLQDMLTGDCTCGLEDENMALKAKNESLEIQLEKLRHRVGELETAASSRDLLDKEYQRQIAEKEKEFQAIRKSLTEVEAGSSQRSAACETLARQLQQTQVLLDDKSAELARAQREREQLEDTNRQLQHELDKADRVIKEGLRKLMETTEWRDQLDESRAQVVDLERQLQRACCRCRELEDCCRQRQAALEAAHARGAALCEESRRVTAAVRAWMRRQRARAREQQEKIKEQETMLFELQRCLEARQHHSLRLNRDQSVETEPRCSLARRVSETTSYPRCLRPQHAVSESEMAFSRCGLSRQSEIASCSRCASNRQEVRERSSESEIASCSTAPVPPRRQKKRLPPCGDIRCPCAPAAAPSPTEEIIERVETLHAALEDGQRRWARARR